MKKIILLLILLNILPACAITIDELNTPKNIENRIGTSNKIEEPLQIKTKSNWLKKNAKDDKNIFNKNLTYADLSLKKISEDVLYDLGLEEGDIARDLEILWIGTAQKSETVRYAIYKLSNPDGEQSSDNMLKKIIKPIASFSTLAGTAFSTNPYIASSTLVGGALLGKLGVSDSELNSKFTKVSDTGMVLLVRKIDKLQEKLLLTYLEYKKYEKMHNMALESLKKREEIYQASQNEPREKLIIADVYYRNAQNKEEETREKLWSAEQTLIQFAGKDAFEKIAKPK